MSEQIKKVPAVALRGMTILPGMIAHFDVSRERSIHAVEQAMMDDEQIFLVTQRNAEENEPEAEDLYQIGILASIKQVIKMQDNIVRVLVEGTKRAQLQELFSEGTYLAAEVMTFSDTEDLSDGAKEAMLRGVVFLPVDLYKSHWYKFTMEDGKIRMPFSAVAGLGEAAAKSLHEAADPNDPYISCDDLQSRTGISKSVVQSLRDLGALDGLPETSQMTFF